MRALTASDLADLYDWPSLIDCLRDGFTRECRAPLRQHYTIEVSGAPDGTLLTMPAWTEDDLLGVKLVGNALEDLAAARLAWTRAGNRAAS